MKTEINEKKENKNYGKKEVKKKNKRMIRKE